MKTQNSKTSVALIAILSSILLLQMAQYSISKESADKIMDSKISFSFIKDQAKNELNKELLYLERINKVIKNYEKFIEAYKGTYELKTNREKNTIISDLIDTANRDTIQTEKVEKYTKEERYILDKQGLGLCLNDYINISIDYSKVSFIKEKIDLHNKISDLYLMDTKNERYMLLKNFLHFIYIDKKHPNAIDDFEWGSLKVEDYKISDTKKIKYFIDNNF